MRYTNAMPTDQKAAPFNTDVVTRVLTGLASESPALLVSGEALTPEEVADPAGGLPALVTQAGVFRQVLWVGPGAASANGADQPPPDLAWTLKLDTDALFGVRAVLTRPPSDLDWLLIAGTLRQVGVLGADLTEIMRNGGIDPVRFSGIACIRGVGSVSRLTDGLLAREKVMPAPHRPPPVRPAVAPAAVIQRPNKPQAPESQED